jgi:hypothetical protein
MSCRATGEPALENKNFRNYLSPKASRSHTGCFIREETKSLLDPGGGGERCFSSGGDGTGERDGERPEGSPGVAEGSACELKNLRRQKLQESTLCSGDGDADGLAEPVEGSDPKGELGGGDSLAPNVSLATSRCRRRHARW